MDSEQLQHLKDLREIYQRRLRVLELQAANKGQDTPPHIWLEIDDIKKKIDDLDAQIAGKKPAIDRPRILIDRRWIWTIVVVLIGASIIAIWLANAAGETRGRQIAEAELQPTIDLLRTTIDLLRIRPMAVDSTQGWQSTGIMIAKGDKVTIRVVGGKWTSWRKLLPENIRDQLPDGIKSEFPAETWLNWSAENDGGGEKRICAQCPVKNYTPSALVASIGNKKYGIGNSCGFKSVSDGELFLRINDDDLNDNSGVLSVKITIGQSFDNLNSPACGTPVD